MKSGALAAAGLLAGATLADSPLSRYLGSPSCSSSSCHGGAGERRSQFGQWNTRDVHRRAHATLTLARSTQIGLALREQVGDPANSRRCTVCHAPFANVPENLRLAALDRTDGVSCESCHGPAEPWIRSHTRTDVAAFGYPDKVAAGLRDLRSLYVRANTCVACHENVDRDLLEAGHPELMFELDGQSVTEPRHWREPEGFHGAKAWLVGQAVAWREVAWYAAKPEQKSPHLDARAEGLRWVVTRAATAAGITATAPDEIARVAAAKVWTAADTVAVLKALAGGGAELGGPAAGPGSEPPARRAERLVLALDRLVAASDPGLEAKVGDDLRELFRLVQSLPDFPGPNREKFAATLEKFAGRL